MRRLIIAALVCFAFSPQAFGWNNRGHMVVARLAWLKLTPDQRQKVSDILKQHPHYDEFLAVGKPSGTDEDQWVFLKAATWPDWVKNHHTADYSHPNWHYINLPFVQEGSGITPPSLPSENVVSKLDEILSQVDDQTGNDAAVSICWILHLIGDIHQPLHCATFYGRDFPQGDKGGNRAFAMLAGHKIQLHKFWDGLLGNSTTFSAIAGMAQEIQGQADQDPQVLEADLRAHRTPQSWSEEGLANAKKYAYADGQLIPANGDEDLGDDEIPDVPRSYATDAGQIARVCAAKGGERLAQTLAKIVE